MEAKKGVVGVCLYEEDGRALAVRGFCVEQARFIQARGMHKGRSSVSVLCKQRSEPSAITRKDDTCEGGMTIILPSGWKLAKVHDLIGHNIVFARVMLNRKIKSSQRKAPASKFRILKNN